jgi:hypothetical protein
METRPIDAWFLSSLEVESKYDKKLRSLREELELRRKTEIHEIEEVRSLNLITANCLLIDGSALLIL